MSTKCQTKKLYKGVFNYNGEIHELYRSARCGANQAKNYMMVALSKKLGISIYYLKNHFSGKKDNLKIMHHRGENDTAKLN